jgi:putative transcriptional regulator
MNTVHQTSEDLLLRYAAGQLRPAPALVVASHVAMSQSSRAILGQFENVGGVLIEEQPMAELSDGLFEQTLTQIGERAREETFAEAHDHGHLAMGIVLPEPLARRKIGPWRWLGPGMRFARIEMPEDPDHNLVLLRVPAGRALPEHSHSGEEVTLVLKGSFHDEAGRYMAGDLIGEDEETDHTPVVDDGGECICLASIEGSMRIKSWLGRLAQPFIGL